MLDRDLLRHQPDAVRAGIARKRLEAPVDAFLEIDTKWRHARAELESMQSQINAVSKSIGALMAQKKVEEANEAKAEAKRMSDQIPAVEHEVRLLEQELHELELQMPNLPHGSVPDGADETENVVVREWGEKPTFSEEPLPHWEIAEQRGLLDLPRSAKIAGSGFALYSGAGARLQRALGTMMIQYQTAVNGYHEFYPPYMVNRAALIGTGNLPKFEDDLYKADDDLYLIPTAEVPLTNLYRDEIIDGDKLPIRLAGLSACFRREAGAAGKDTRGVLRIHQFDKVELVWFTKPEDSYAALETLIGHAEGVLQALGLHYRVLELCSGDLGQKAAKCYDLEVWSPGVGRYLEISSCSNFEAYQSRRANIRFRRETGAKPEFVHILNGSGLATPRLFSAITETYLQPSKPLELPEILRPHLGPLGI